MRPASLRSSSLSLALSLPFVVAAAPPAAAPQETLSALDFEALDLRGNRFSSAGLRGQIVLLDFWAVWCPPCLEAFPTLERLEREFKDQGFRVVSVAVFSGTVEDVRKVAAQHGLNQTVVVGDAALAERFDVIGFPTYFLIDRGGRIHEQYVGDVKDLYERAAADIRALLAKSAARQTLSLEAQRIVDYLLEDWGKQFRSTSIPLAMSNMALAPSDDLRLEVGRHFRDHPGLHNNVRFWGANNYILTNREKLIAKHLINNHPGEGPIPAAKDLAGALGIKGGALEDSLAFLARAGLLENTGGETPGYRLARGYGTWGGPLRYNFHTVTVDGGKPFDVW